MEESFFFFFLLSGDHFIRSFFCSLILSFLSVLETDFNVKTLITCSTSKIFNIVFNVWLNFTRNVNFPNCHYFDMFLFYFFIDNVPFPFLTLAVQKRNKIYESICFPWKQNYSFLTNRPFLNQFLQD
jgi:hypothetical protein